MELNSGLTAFADNQSDGSKSHIERYHRYDFDTKEESIEEIIVETNSFTDGETTAGYFPNGKISDIDLSDLYAIIGSNDITVVDNPTATPYCSTVCLHTVQTFQRPLRCRQSSRESPLKQQWTTNAFST